MNYEDHPIEDFEEGCEEEVEIDIFDRDLDSEYGHEEERMRYMNPISIQLPDDVLENIAERAARNVHAKVEEMAKVKLAGLVDDLWRDTLKQNMSEMAQGLIREWMEKPRPLTNSFGEKVGEGSSFSERLLKDWQEYLTKPVNHRGEPSSGYYDKDGTRLEFLIKQFAMPHLEGIAKEAVQKVQTEARARVQEALSAFLAQQLAPRVELKAIKG